MLFSYKIAYKVMTRYTPYQLVFGLHPLMPTKYLISVVGGDEKDNTPMKIFSRITKFKKLQKVRMQVIETTRIHSGIKHYGKNKRIKKKNLMLAVSKRQ
jgi:hypothetical protein